MRVAARPRRARPGAAVRLAALLATATTLLVTSTVVAAADPTPTPEPSASSSASATPAPAPSATGPDAATPTPTEPTPSTEATEPTPSAPTPGPDVRGREVTPTPSATPSTASPTPAPNSSPASAARDFGSLVQRLLRKHPWIKVPTSASRPPAARGQLEVFVLSNECQQGTAPVPVDTSVLNAGDQTADVFFQVSRASRAVASGALSIPPGEVADFTVGLTAGAYELTFANAEGGPPVLTVEFRVLQCIRTRVSCGAITFINPAVNPPVEVQYGSFGEEVPDGEGTISSGGELTVATTRTTLDYVAFFDVENADAFTVSLAGTEADVAIPTEGCGVENAEIDSIETECATAGEADGSVEAEVEVPAGQPIRYEVTRSGRSRVVARGSAPAGEDREDNVKFDGLGRGSYVLRAYVGDADEASDRKRFRVKKCAEAPVAEAPADPEPTEPPVAEDPLAATGGVSPLWGLGALLALAGAALLRLDRRQRGR